MAEINACKYVEVNYRGYPKDYTFKVPEGLALAVGDHVVVERCDYDPDPTFLVGQVTKVLPAPRVTGIDLKEVVCKVPVTEYLQAKEDAEVREAILQQIEDAMVEHRKMQEYKAAAATNSEIADLLIELASF